MMLPPPPRRLRVRFVLLQVGAGCVLGLLGAVLAVLALLADGWWLRLVMGALAIVLLRVGVIRILCWRVARAGEETVVGGRPAIGFRRRVLILRADGYPLVLSEAERRRLEMRKLVSDIHTC